MAMGKVKRPALKFYGGKWRLAPWIISYFPKHTHYIEPCFGGGNILLRKEKSELETVNDINGRLVNFFKQLRDRPNELISLVDLTPWAQQEYELSKVESSDPLEDARRFFIMSWMSVNGAPLPTGFRVAKKRGSRWTIPPGDIVNHALAEVSDRLRHVQVMCMDAIDFIEKFNGDSEGLIYFDPPYPKNVRTGSFYGNFEMFEDLHKPAAVLLRESETFVVVSGYNNSIYNDLYNGWTRVSREHRAQSNKKRVESIWLSPKTVEALNDLDNL